MVGNSTSLVGNSIRGHPLFMKLRRAINSLRRTADKPFLLFCVTLYHYNKVFSSLGSHNAVWYSYQNRLLYHLSSTITDVRRENETAETCVSLVLSCISLVLSLNFRCIHSYLRQIALAFSSHTFHTPSMHLDSPEYKPILRKTRQVDVIGFY